MVLIRYPSFVFLLHPPRRNAVARASCLLCRVHVVFRTKTTELFLKLVKSGFKLENEWTIFLEVALVMRYVHVITVITSPSSSVLFFFFFFFFFFSFSCNMQLATIRTYPFL